jgi:hypothetical protein
VSRVRKKDVLCINGSGCGSYQWVGGLEERVLPVKNYFVKKLPVGGGAGGGSALRIHQLCKKHTHKSKGIVTRDFGVAC